MFLGRKINIVKMTILPNAIYRFNAQVKSESKVAQLCPTLCDPVDYSLPGSSIHGILQARILEWVAISFSRGSSRPRDWTEVSRIAGRCFTLWATREDSLSLFQNKKFHNSYGNRREPKQPKQSSERRMELEESTLLTSDYTTKLQSSRQHGTGTKTEIQTNGTRQAR